VKQFARSTKDMDRYGLLSDRYILSK